MSDTAVLSVEISPLTICFTKLLPVTTGFEALTTKPVSLIFIPSVRLKSSNIYLSFSNTFS